MKLNTFFQTIISTIILLTALSCSQENDFNSKEALAEFKIVPYTQNKTTNYTDNYVVSQATTNIDVANDKISLEIPIPKNDYELLRVYNISTDTNAAILYLIGRNDTKKVVEQPINYLIEDEISISELGLDTNLLQNGNGLRIFVMNNSQEIETDSTIYNCLMDNVDDVNFNENSCGSDNKNESADGPMIVGGRIVFI